MSSCGSSGAGTELFLLLLAALVIDQNEAAITQPVHPIDPESQLQTCQFKIALLFDHLDSERLKAFPFHVQPSEGDVFQAGYFDCCDDITERTRVLKVHGIESGTLDERSEFRRGSGLKLIERTQSFPNELQG